MPNATALIVATHPTTSLHLANVRRLISCAPAGRIVISTSSELLKRTTKALEGPRVRIVSSTNDRYDTGKWCAGLDAIGEHALKHYRWIILANDSIFLLHAMPQLFAALSTGRYDMAGAVATAVGWDVAGEQPSSSSYHLQSFLRVFTRGALGTWQKRSCGLPPTHESFRTKRSIVLYHEIGSSQAYPRERLYGLYNGDSPADARGASRPWHLNLSYWREAWPRGFPVAKRPQLETVCPEHHDELTGLEQKTGAGLAACLESTFGRCAKL